MKVAPKSSESRYTITVPPRTYSQIEKLRTGQPRSVFVERLVEQEAVRREREEFVTRLRSEYTEDVCRETLKINEEFPIHETARSNLLEAHRTFVKAAAISARRPR